MIIIHLLLLLLLLGVPGYVRDVLTLPFFGPRILWVNCYLVLFALLFCGLLLRQLPIPTTSPGIGAQRTGLVTGAMFFAASFAVTGLLHADPLFFVPLEVLIFALALAVLVMIASRGQLPVFLDRLNVALNLLIAYQVAALIAGQFVPLSHEMTASRNLWPYIGAVAFALNRHFGRPGAIPSLLRALALTTINGTKAGFVLLAAIIFADLLARYGRRAVLNYLFAMVLMLVAVVTHVFFYRFGLDALMMGSVSELEGLRSGGLAYIDNNIASAISRVFSVPYTLEVVVQEKALFGLGEARAAQVTFWGYPVHNLFVSYIAIFGSLGAIFSFMYLSSAFRVARTAPAVFAVALFVPLVANDLYPMLALCALPLLCACTEPAVGRATAAW